VHRGLLTLVLQLLLFLPLWWLLLLRLQLWRCLPRPLP
jgi:hypothetical protein